MEDWAEVRRLHKAEGLSIKEIVRRTGIARNTVRSALRSEEPPSYRREGPGSAVDAVEPRIRVPIVLLYPGTVEGNYGLRFMGKTEPAYGYRAMIVVRGERGEKS